MELLSTLPPGKLTTSSVSETMRLQLVELLPQLERYCVSEPTSSPHLEGTWSVAYVVRSPRLCPRVSRSLSYLRARARVLQGTPAPGLLPSPTREAALLLYAGGFSPAVFGLAVSEKLPSNVLSVNELTLAISPLQPRATVTADVSAFGRAATVRISSSLEIESASRLLETWSSVDVGNGFTALPAPLQYKRRVFVRFLDDTLAIIRDETGTPTVLTRAGGSEPSTPHPAAAVTATADAAAHKPTSVKAAAEGAGFEPPAAAEEQGFAPEAHTPEVL